MKNLKPIKKYDICLYDEITKSKRNEQEKANLKTLRPVIKSRYHDYEENSQELSDISCDNNFSSSDKELLCNCYKSRSRKMAKIRVEIKELQTDTLKKLCPYCGIGKPDTLDHYLPKGIFPEFSILGINLIPCCPTCNTKKGEWWLNGSNRAFINIYFDTFIEKKFLCAKIFFNDERSYLPLIKFYLEQPEDICNDNFSIIKSHFEKLELLDLYQEYCSSDLIDLFEEICLAAKNGISIKQEKETFFDCYINSVKKSGINYWKNVMKIAILDSDEFFDKAYASAENLSVASREI